MKGNCLALSLALLTAGCHGIQANPAAPGPSAPFADPIYVVTLTADAMTLPFGGGTVVHANVEGAPDGTRVVFSVANGSMWIEPTEPGSLDTVDGQAHAKYHRAAHTGAVKVGASVNSASRAEPLELTVLEPPVPESPPQPPPPPPPPPDPPYVPQPQVAVSLAVSPTTGTTVTVFTFTATAVAHSGATPVTSYAWTFGDGSSATTAGNSTTHTYATTGTKTARVVASNGTQQASDTVDVTVTAIGLSVNVTVAPAVVVIGVPVTLTATVTSSAPVPASLQFEWDAEGDGNYEATQVGSSPNNFITSYSSTGNRTARVRVTDPISGAQGSGSKPITVNP